MFLLQRQKRIVSCVFLQFFFSSGQRILDLSLNVKLSYIPTLFPHTSLCEQLDFSVPRSICMSCHGSLTTQSRSLNSQEQLPLMEPELVQHAFSWPGSCCEPSFAERGLRWQGDGEGKWLCRTESTACLQVCAYYEPKPGGLYQPGT